MDHMFESPMSLLSEGLPLTSKVAAVFYREIMLMMHQGLVTLEQRAGFDGHFLVMTEKGLKWYKGYLQEKQSLLSKQAEVLEQVGKGSPTENTETQAVDMPAGAKRFRDIPAGTRFKILVGKGQHKLRYRKVSDAEEDNALTDTEDPEACTFPEDQPVYPAS